MNRFKYGVALAALATCLAVSTTQADELVVFNGFSTPGEIAAVTVLKNAWEKMGHTWKDMSATHDTGANVSLLNMITGGNPPAIFWSADTGLYRDLAKQGLGVPLTDVYDKATLDAFLPVVRKAITVDGQIMKAPGAIHIDGMIYYNKHVADAVGVDPKSWKSFDDFFAVFDKIKAAGYVPLALGGDKFQEAYLLQAIIASEAGPDVYNKFYGEKPDREAIASPEMRQALDRYRQLANHVDAGSPNRPWNEATNMVITGKALMQIQGDWMKGEFRVANKVLGTDYDCANLPGAKAVVVTVDAWGFVNMHNPETLKAQLDFAKVDVDPAVTAEFAAKKGSTPIRADVDPSLLDACNQLVLNTLKDPNKQVPNPYNTADADWYRTVWDEADKFWNNPKESNDDFIKAMQDAYDQIF